MIAVAHAHAEEAAAVKLRARAAARFACVVVELHRIGVSDPTELSELEWRRYIRARVAAAATARAAFTAGVRHSKWYRAFRRARRRVVEGEHHGHA